MTQQKPKGVNGLGQGHSKGVKTEKPHFPFLNPHNEW